ncbi:hypothetical protein [Haloarcula sp. CBA1127]|uniref:hypothetical protein n=1 Tax=Haloarcula sp. CBA1127 TaxID=1765055 RepID=UPI00073E9FA6|nr:hypothetical protein [Haloarcula sp. CBA1127]
MGFFDRWSPNDDGSFTDTQDDSAGSSDSDGSDDDSGSTRPGSSVPNNLSGGGSSDPEPDPTPEPTQEQDQLLDGSTGSSSSGGGSSDPIPDDPFGDNDNPFADDDSGGSSSGGDEMPDESGDMPEDNATSGQGIGPGGVSGSEAATPDAELDAPTNDSTEGIEATKTGELEDTASDPRIREQAQSLEQQLTGTKVTDAVDGLKTTGAELREEDVQVVRDGDTLRAELSPVGRERVGNIADRQADEAAERVVEEQLNTSFTNEDVTVDDSGNIDVSQNVQNEATEQTIAANNPGVRESDITFEDGDPTVNREQTDPQDRVAENLSNELGITEGEDFTTSREAPANRVPTERGQGDVRVDITESGAQELRGRREQQEGDIFTGAVAALERSPGTAINTGALLLSRDLDSNASVDLPGEGSLIGRGRQDAATDPGDRFGGDLDIPFTDIGFVEGSDAAAGFVEESFISPTADLAGDVFALGQAGSQIAGAGNPVAIAQGTAGPEQSARALNNTETRVQDLARGESEQQSEQVALETLGEGTTRGGLGIANVPRVANAVFEAGSFTVEAGEQTASGDGGEFAQDATEAGALRAGQAAEFAASNPLRFTSQLAGGAVTSSSLIRLGRLAGGSSGSRAVSAVVQPGEELAIAAARRGAVSAGVASKVPGVRKEQIIPESKGGSGDPLVDIDIDDTGSSSTAVESTDFRSDSGGTSTTGRVRERVGEFLDDESAAAGPGSRTRQRQRQRQRPEQEPVVEIDVENDPLVRARQRRQQAQESDIETRIRADGRLRAAQRLEAETGTAAVQTPSVGLGTETGVGLDTEQFGATVAVTEPTLALEARQELATEPVTETRSEQRQETRTEARQELATETAVETRTEFGSELRTETRTETDTDDDLLDDDDLFGGGSSDIDTATRRFEYGVASPDDVLSGDAGLSVSGDLLDDDLGPV